MQNHFIDSVMKYVHGGANVSDLANSVIETLVNEKYETAVRTIKNENKKI